MKKIFKKLERLRWAQAHVLRRLADGVEERDDWLAYSLRRNADMFGEDITEIIVMLEEVRDKLVETMHILEEGKSKCNGH